MEQGGRFEYLNEHSNTETIVAGRCVRVVRGDTSAHEHSNAGTNALSTQHYRPGAIMSRGQAGSEYAHLECDDATAALQHRGTSLIRNSPPPQDPRRILDSPAVGS